MYGAQPEVQKLACDVFVLQLHQMKENNLCNRDPNIIVFALERPICEAANVWAAK